MFFSFSINIIIIEAFLWIFTWGQEMRLRFIVDAFTDPTCSSTTQVPAICLCGPWKRKSTSRDRLRTVNLASVTSSPMERLILLKPHSWPFPDYISLTIQGLLIYSVSILSTLGFVFPHSDFSSSCEQPINCNSDHQLSVNKIHCFITLL